MDGTSTDRSRWSPGPTARWTLVAAVAVAIFVGSVVNPGSGPPGTPDVVVPVPIPEPVARRAPGADKFVHFGAYLTLAATLAYALAPRGVSLPVLAGLVLGVAAFGFAVELVQWPLPYRTFDLADATANALGGLVVAAAWWSLDALSGSGRGAPS